MVAGKRGQEPIQVCSCQSAESSPPHYTEGTCVAYSSCFVIQNIASVSNKYSKRTKPTLLFFFQYGNLFVPQDSL